MLNWHFPQVIHKPENCISTDDEYHKLHFVQGIIIFLQNEIRYQNNAALANTSRLIYTPRKTAKKRVCSGIRFFSSHLQPNSCHPSPTHLSISPNLYISK